METNTEIASRLRRRRVVGITTAASVLVLFGLAGCAGGHPGAAPPAGIPTGDASGFDDVVNAVQAARIAWCRPEEGGAYVALPAPPPEAAATAAYFRYVEGRIYQFAPCDLSSAQRNELRLFRYPDTGVRDGAIREMALRNSRPTAAFAVGDVFEAEIWSRDPSLAGAAGRAAAAVHSAIGHLEQARHLDVGP